MRTSSDPERIGRYAVKGRIGAGGMGIVYRAEDPDIGRIVAIKVLDSTDDQSRHARFRQEVRSAGTLQHRHIVTVHDFGEDAGRPFIVMEYVEGRTLADLLREGSPLSSADKLRVAKQLCEALEYAHERGVIHRDVKPSNLMVDQRGDLRVVDFGVARTGDGDLTTTGEVIGTVRYMSPEQLEGKPVDRRTDIFSVGVVLYELFTGRQAFQGETSGQLIRNILTEQPPAVTSLRPDLDPALDRIIGKAIEKRPSQRYATLSNLSADLSTVEPVRPLGAASVDATRTLIRAREKPVDAVPTGAMFETFDTPPASALGAQRAVAWLTALGIGVALLGVTAWWEVDSFRPAPEERAATAREDGPVPEREIERPAPKSVEVPSPPNLPKGTTEETPAKTMTVQKPTIVKREQAPPVEVPSPPQARAPYAEAEALERSRQPGDVVRGLALYKTGCEAGDAEACNRAGFMLQNHAAVRNLSEATQMFQRSCDAGIASGCNFLGVTYARGGAVPRDEATAASLFRRACEAGYAPGCQNSGRAFRSGRGVPKDDIQARMMFQKACDAAVSAGCVDLAVMMARGEGGGADEPTAVELFRRGCDANIAAGCVNLGIAYARGTVVPRDLSRALSLYRRACDAGDAMGCSNAAVMYASGRGVLKDDGQANVFFQRACDGNRAADCRSLAYRYGEGIGGERDTARAAELNRRAGELGATPARTPPAR